MPQDHSWPLVISETMEHGVRAGVKVALAPILKDLPIIIITIFILAKLSSFHSVLGVISILGAFFIIYMGIENLRIKRIEVAINKSASRSFQKRIIVNALSPHPYLFWFSAGGPTTIKATAMSLTAAISFVLSFYVLLVGSKIILTFLVGKSRSFLLLNYYLSKPLYIPGIIGNGHLFTRIKLQLFNPFPLHAYGDDQFRNFNGGLNRITVPF